MSRPITIVRIPCPGRTSISSPPAIRTIAEKVAQAEQNRASHGMRGSPGTHPRAIDDEMIHRKPGDENRQGDQRADERGESEDAEAAQQQDGMCLNPGVHPKGCYARHRSDVQKTTSVISALV